jgi:hypothetical protein
MLPQITKLLKLFVKSIHLQKYLSQIGTANKRFDLAHLLNTLGQLLRGDPYLLPQLLNAHTHFLESLFNNGYFLLLVSLFKFR